MGTALQEKKPQMTEVFGDNPARLLGVGREALRLRKLRVNVFLWLARELISREDTEVINLGKDTEKLTHPVTFTIGDRNLNVRVRQYTAIHKYDHPTLYQDVHTSIVATNQSTGMNYTLFNVTQEYYPHQAGEIPTEVSDTQVTNDQNKRATNHEVFRGAIAAQRITAMFSETPPQQQT